MNYTIQYMIPVMQSPQIAETSRKPYKMLDYPIRMRPGYEKLPQKAIYTCTQVSVKLEHKLMKEVSTRCRCLASQ